ncbi:MAG: aminoacyl-tRNA hydrolase [Lachnospiraceae bacterium]|nr:aminoacyl-tRNA hydrolase [Lachnospiraceae bacterium]
MYIIVGLGNPSPEYAGTRHNAGFEVVNILADRFDIETDYIKHKAICGRGVIEGNKVMLAMPQTFMNLSGESVRQLVDYYKIDVPTELIVVYDDINLSPGRIRIRKSGSAGGHNGMKNIITHLGTDEFMRIRVGVGDKPKGYDLADHVLGHFTEEERRIMEVAFIDAANSVVTILNDGIDAAMNRYNGSKKEEDEIV